MRSRFCRFVLLVLLVVSAGAAVRAGAASRFVNHVDPSLIKEIVVRGDKLYVATFGGLVVYDYVTGEFTQYNTTAGLTTVSLTCLVFDDTDRLWLGSADFGIARATFSGSQLNVGRSFSQQINGLADNNILTLAVWGDSVTYGTISGMGTIHRNFASNPLRKQDGLPDDEVLDVLPAGDFVWVATDSGVVVLDRQGFLNPVPGAPAEANAFGTDGSTIFVGTDNGVRRFDPADSSWTDLGLTTPSRKIDSFFYDGQSMWAAGRFILWNYTGSGQSWIETRMDSFIVRYEMNGASSRAGGLVRVPNGDIYMGIGQDNQGRGTNLIHFDGNVSRTIVPNVPGGRGLSRLSYDAANGDLWCTFNSYYVGKLTADGDWFNYNGSITGADSMSNRAFNIGMHAGSDGVKWFATTPLIGTLPIDKLRDNRDTDYSNDTWERVFAGDGGLDGLGSQAIQRIVEDPQGHTWLLSDAKPDNVTIGWYGMNIYNAPTDEWLTVSPTTTSGLMPNGDVVDVAFGNSFTWLALREWGIQAWSHSGFGFSSLEQSVTNPAAWSSNPLRVGQTNELPDVVISCVALRSDGVLWIGTDNGVFSWDTLNRPRQIPGFTGIGVGLLSPLVNDLIFDHEENLWVATSAGLNRVDRDDESDIQAFSTPAEYQRSLRILSYPLDVITELVHENCFSLELHPTEDLLYIGTLGGLSVLDFSPAPPTATDLSNVYVYPNPLYGRKNHNELKIENITGPVTIEVYTIEGELVHEQSASQPGDVIWDLTTRAGFVAASGTYLVRISAASGSVVKTVAIIR